ncbi:T9SS type A sorting domain-containing protein [Winogradskyella pulchriflava]|uniref:T9SS type A sorting domain-containing protein n=1 Tax=Winogradskyella pulchriflava TaxID=1110688 RepID=A0ABV6QD52_9FLAO
MKHYLLFALFIFSILSFAQNIPDEVKPPSWGMDELTTVTPHRLASFDLKKLQDEDMINDKDKSKPWRFGYDIYVDHDFNEVGEWTTLDNGDRIWRMSYKSKNAVSLNFMFDVFKLPEGAKLFVYNDEKSDLLRPYTHHNNNPEEVLGTWLVKGDQAWIEYYEPANVVGEAKITIGSVIHGYRSGETYQKALNDSGACNHDVDCDITPASDPYGLDTVKENVKKSVGMITVNGGTGICTGTLVNNTNNDGTPYFITANHCLGGSVNSWAFRFNWRSPNPSCGTFTNSTNGTFNQTVSGATLRASSSQSDMALVEITDPTFFNGNPDVVWAGWNRSTTQNPNVNFGIHHPSGDIQKVCREDDGAYRTAVNFNGNPTTQMWFIDQWELGVTEPGSSGSALFNETGHLIGMLSGGSAACSGTSNNGGVDFYGRFGVAWNFGANSSQRVMEWLDPAGTGDIILDQYPAIETFDNDARVSESSGGGSLICGDFTPEVTLINAGALNLTSADVTYYVDSNAGTTVNWTGNLANNASEVVASPTFSGLTVGSHTFTITVSNPNGTADENTANDSFILNFEVPESYSTATVVFNITTDDYGNETTYELANSSGTVVASGPVFDYNDNTTYSETLTIPGYDECYTFTIFDSYGDGICCGFGNGSYNLEDENGNVIISGGQFDSAEAVTFNAMDPLGLDEYTLEDYINIYPNPAKSVLNINISGVNEDLDYQIYNTVGQIILKGSFKTQYNKIDLSQYQSGVYFVKLSSNRQSITRKVVKE